MESLQQEWTDVGTGGRDGRGLARLREGSTSGTEPGS